MTKYLLDPSILTELYTDPSRGLSGVYGTIPDSDVAVCEISIEIATESIMDLNPSDAEAVAAQYDAHVREQFAGRILSMSRAVNDLAEELSKQVEARYPDATYDAALIVAFSRIHGYEIWTRLPSHYRSFGMNTVNPWTDMPVPPLPGTRRR